MYFNQAFVNKDPQLYSMIPGFSNNRPKLIAPGRRFPEY